MPDLLRIGTIEDIALPKNNIESVSAKVDTGADGSSIWATNIRLVNGELQFNFFGPGFVLYDPETYRTKTYKVTTVKNSFGDKEFRYKVRFQVKLGKTKITRWFTLADRARNNFPILLGKNFLRNKFLVDVSKDHLLSNSDTLHKIAVFTARKEENEEFFNRVKAFNTANVEYDFIHYSDLEYQIDGTNSKIIDIHNNYDIACYSYIYFKDHHSHELAFAAAEYLNYQKRPFADREFYNSMSASKLSEYMKLTSHNLPVPTTFCSPIAHMREQYERIKQVLSLPFVLKEMKSDRGKYNYLIHSKKDFLKILDEAPEGHNYLAQKYVPNNGFYRIYVLGKEAELAVWRSAVPRDDKLKAHLNKPKGSSNAVKVAITELDGEAEGLALKAADSLDRQVAGVDIIQDSTTKQWYILEVNNDPQIRTGSFVDQKVEMIAKFIDKELNQ